MFIDLNMVLVAALDQQQSVTVLDEDKPEVLSA